MHHHSDIQNNVSSFIHRGELWRHFCLANCSSGILLPAYISSVNNVTCMVQVSFMAVVASK